MLLTKTRLEEKLAKLEEEVKRLAGIEKALLASPDKQISLTDPDCRSMATSGRGSGMVAYNVQSAVDTTNHLIVAHEVTNVGTDRSQDVYKRQVLCGYVSGTNPPLGLFDRDVAEKFHEQSARRDWAALLSLIHI